VLPGVLRSYEEQKRNKASTKIMLPLDSLALGQARLSVEIRQYESLYSTRTGVARRRSS
jgi:hypothetical protein